jgi:energy-coupling factor transport system substrate-specific component
MKFYIKREVSNDLCYAYSMTKFRYWTNLISLAKDVTIFETVFTAVVSATLGILFWGWTFVYDVFKPFLKVLGLNYALAGIWIISAILVASIVRRPGIAILAALIAAFVESLFTHWGLISLSSGLAQGLGAEIIFLLFMYRRWELPIIILASLASASMSYITDYYLYDYARLSKNILWIQYISFLVSAFFLSALLSSYIVKRLQKLGVLNRFLIMKNSDV